MCALEGWGWTHYHLLIFAEAASMSRILRGEADRGCFGCQQVLLSQGVLDMAAWTKPSAFEIVVRCADGWMGSE